MNCSNDSWKEDLVVLGSCEGRRGRKRRRKRVEKLSGGLIEGVEWLLTKQFVHLIWISQIHQIEAGAASIIKAGPIRKVMGSCHIN